MTKMRISDQDLERLVHGNQPADQELARLAKALQNWQAGFERTPTEEQVTAFATQAAEIAKQTKPEAIPQTTDAPSRSRFQALKHKLAIGMATLLMFSGMTGVAVASDGAAPGDALYELDRALESVGINNGGPTERITEAQSLFDAGLPAEAVEHLAEALDDDEATSGAVNALMEAAESVRRNAENGNAEDTLNSVADMLEWMATAERGPAFGQMVSEKARGINDSGPEDVGPPGDPPMPSNENPGENSQNSGEQGRGNQGNQGDPPGPPDGVPGQSKNGRP